MAHDNSHNHNQQQKPQEDIGVKSWWKLPFDPTTNFSLLGYILGGFHWEANLIKRVDLTLNK